MSAIFTKYFAWGIGVLSIAVLIYVFAAPPKSMLVDNMGIPHFMPKVINPDTGEAISVSVLIKHFTGL